MGPKKKLTVEDEEMNKMTRPKKQVKIVTNYFTTNQIKA